jgi:CDP-diacylglycerol---glycerol-3-phosphate 3-phosphatidyltransferase
MPAGRIVEMPRHHKGVFNMNLANRISFVRIAATPLFLFLLIPGPFGQFAGLSAWGRWAAAGLFILASVTDALDGYVARKYNLVTDLGKFLDPIADKLLVTAALVALIQTDGLSVWGVFIILAREFIITGMRIVASGQGTVIAASGIAKWKTTFQLIAIISMLLHDFPITLIAAIPVGLITFWIAVALTIVSGVDYLVKNKGVFLAAPVGKSGRGIVE